MDAPAGTGSHGPFPVAPADVPVNAVRFVQRTMARHGQPVDKELAQVLVAGLIAALAQPSGDGAADPG